MSAPPYKADVLAADRVLKAACKKAVTLIRTDQPGVCTILSAATISADLLLTPERAS